MDRDKDFLINESEKEDYSVSKASRRRSIISYIICVIAAIAIWLLIMNVTDSAESKNPLQETEAVSVYHNVYE